MTTSPPPSSTTGGGPSPDGSAGLDRRRVLSAGAAGIASFALPATAAHASTDPAESGSLAAPTGVTAEPIGYVSGGATGAIRITWNPVTGATGYSVGWATISGGNGPYTPIDVGNVTTYDLTGRDDSDTTHHLVVSATDGDTVSLNSTEVTSSPVIATGGTVTTFTGNGTIGDAGINYVVHEFTSVGTTTFVLNRSRDVEYLVVGGGGGGGARVGAGGGAGAMRTGNFEGMTGSTSVTVGAGGNGAIATGASSAVTAGSDGGDSVFGAITADGGGRGASNIVEGSYGHTAGPSAGNTGASGGGGARSTPAGIGGAHGNDGGAGHEAGTVAAGGGGGAGGVGGAASAGTAGAGGSGATSTITGTSRFYAAGGGGSAQNTAAFGAGGSDIGGDGAGTPETAVPITAGSGTDGTGSGGGGSASNVGANTGGAGGSGVVVVRYALPA
ncbi:MAG: glycine-rich domain-containing protein [Nitriliruptoraceae bacterium]